MKRVRRPASRPAAPPSSVVGAPRSGTTMLAAMLASHRSFAAGPETQFFSKLPFADLEKAAASPDWPDSALALLQRLTLADQPVVELFENTPEGLRAWLEQQPPSIAAMLESLTVPFAERREKPRWVEKTPNHILHVRQIRVLWPDARIIRIVRDPRDVGMSTCRLPTFSNSIAANVYVWLRWQMAAEDFLAADPLTMSVRYEDIVDDAQSELSRICDFLGEEFDPAMVEFGAAAQHVSSTAETWKKSVASGLDSSRKFAWKSAMPDDARLLSNLVCHEYLQRFGYEVGEAPQVTRTAFRMSSDYVERHEKKLFADARRGIRWMPSEDTATADRIVEQPEYSRFRDPILLARLFKTRIGDTIRKRG